MDKRSSGNQQKDEQRSGSRTNNKKAKMSKSYYQQQARKDRQGGRGGGGGGGYGGRGGGGRGGQGYQGQNFSGGGSRGSRRELEFGMKGFLCSCNFNEKDCTKEAYNLLNEYFNEEEDKVVETATAAAAAAASAATDETSESKAEPAKEPEKSESAEEPDEDFEKSIAKEIAQLKSHENVYKFKAVDTGVPNLVFISTTVQAPAKLAHRILHDLHEKREQKSKFLLRMIPIDAICHSNMTDLESTFRKLVPSYFPAGGQIDSFQIVYKSRYNNNISRDDVIKLLAAIVVEQNPLSVVDLTNAKSTLIVEVLRNKICLGMVKDYGRFKRYNLLEIVAPTAAAAAGATAAADAQPKPGEAEGSSSTTTAEPATTDDVSNITVAKATTDKPESESKVENSASTTLNTGEGAPASAAQLTAD